MLLIFSKMIIYFYEKYLIFVLLKYDIINKKYIGRCMKEIFLTKDALITSKTDLKGNIIYANDDFSKYAGYEAKEFLGKPHNIVRHQDMPKTVFKCLWDTIQKGEEIFAFVKK